MHINAYALLWSFARLTYSALAITNSCCAAKLCSNPQNVFFYIIDEILKFPRHPNVYEYIGFREICKLCTFINSSLMYKHVAKELEQANTELNVYDNVGQCTIR